MDTGVREMAMLELVQCSGAIRESITVVREKRVGDEAVVAATFRNSSGRLVRGMLGLRRSHDWGWRTAGGGWSSGPRDIPTAAIWSSSGGWASSKPPKGVMGGWVNEPVARRIKVTDPNGRTEEDVIEAGVAILIWEGNFNASRATAELLDGDGRVIRSGPMRPHH